MKERSPEKTSIVGPLVSYGNLTIYSTWFQHGFHHNGLMRENMLKLINTGYLNNILNIQCYSKKGICIKSAHFDWHAFLLIINGE